MRKKSSIIVTLILLMMVSCMVFASAETESGSFTGIESDTAGQKVYFGDVDGDGVVTATDARSILRYAAQIDTLDETYRYLADVDANGNITAADARIVLRMAAGLEALKDAHTHQYAATQTKAATCEADGMIEYTCSICGDVYTETIPATGQHSYAKTVLQEMNCETDGIIEYKCSICGDMFTETIPATGKHDYVSSVTKKPTYNEKGEETYTCSICGDSYTKAINALKVSNPVYVHLPETPIIVSVFDWSGNRRTIFRVDDLSYSTKYWSYSDNYTLYLSLSGEKTFDSEGDSCSRASEIGWKLYDSEGYVVESGTFFTESIKNYEKTKMKNRVVCSDLPAGEYYLEILDVR